MSDDVRPASMLEFERFLDKLPTGAYICDRDGLITYFNQHALRVWGRTPKLNDPADRFCGSHQMYAADGTAISHAQCWMALALQMNRGYNAEEVVVERPDGERSTLLAHANPMHDEAGNLVGAVNVLVDITERKRTEEALKAADRVKNEFLATLAHELRNPMAPIRNAVQILKDGQGDESERGQAVAVIDRQMQQLHRLVDDLIDVARITGNKLTLRKERIELSAVLRAAIETSRPVIDAAHHAFVYREPAQPIFVEGDLTRLAQVFSNLLHNAAKYTEGQGHIWLSAERQGSDAVITVRDTGIGILEQVLPRIFDMFAQGDRALVHSRDGLGIGLTLVKRLVEMHGGSIRAHSGGAGKGSEFVVRLPVALEAAGAGRVAPQAPARSSSPAGLRILVVDDNKDSVTSLAMLLRMAGNDIRTASDGLEAVGAAHTFRPDVILLDIGLPRMSGHEAAERIRSQPWGRGMVLIALSGWSQESDKVRSKAAGFDYHLVKPVDPSELLTLLASLQVSMASNRVSVATQG